MERLFHEQQETIRKAAAFYCRRYAFGREDVEDFTQHVLCKIWADDCAVLRKYQGRSSLTTYLAIVVHRTLQDYVNAIWGKWRPSAEARRLGRLAIELETLLVRDRMAFDEACQTLRSRGVTASDAELSALAGKLRPPSPRRLDAWHEQDGGGGWAAGGARRPPAGPGRQAEPAAAETADGLLWSKDRERRWQAAITALRTALAALPPEDRLMVKMLGEFSIAEIARTRKLDQKALYRWRDKILERLREALEGSGVSAEDVAEILDHVDT